MVAKRNPIDGSHQEDFTVPFVTREPFEQTEGVNDSWKINCVGIGKDNKTLPYVIVNEYVSANVAHYMRLPTPPFGLFQKTRRNLMFGTLNFEGDSKPRFVDPRSLYANRPETCAGIIAFDIIIANCDRGRHNLKVDSIRNPKDVFVFDHDRALLGTVKSEGTKRLRQLTNRLGISGGSTSGGHRHCLIDVFDDPTLFKPWLHRIRTMPRTYIEDACDVVRNKGANKRELKGIADFIHYRCQNIFEIIDQHRNEFPAVADWPMIQ